MFDHVITPQSSHGPDRSCGVVTQSFLVELMAHGKYLCGKEIFEPVQRIFVTAFKPYDAWCEQLV